MLSRTIFRNLKGCSFFTRSIHPLFFSSAADDEISEAEKVSNHRLLSSITFKL